MKFSILFALLLSPPLWAGEAAHPGVGTWANVTVVGVTACTSERCPPKGWVTFQLSAPATGTPPACSAENRSSVAVDLSTPTGAFAVQMLKMASLTGTPLTVTGTGKCSVDAVIEAVATVTETASRNR